jgi:phosphoribosylanthranilate isomerase
MTMVKICGLTNLHDARWAWECGADLLGFVFVPSSPRCVTQEEAAAITERLAAEGCQAKLVGVFASQPLEQVGQVVKRCSLDLAQLHGGEEPEYVGRLRIPVIIGTRVREGIDWDELASHRAWAYLLDSYDPKKLGGTGHAWDWELLRGARRTDLRLIIAGGLTPDNVPSLVRQLKPWGVDVSSGVEAAPGRKDPDKVARFIECVREESEHDCRSAGNGLSGLAGR